MVMAAMLGGVFGSRLNLRLREELGYTYSARSAFDPRRAVGPFTATAAVQTEVTVDAIRELLGQLERIRASSARRGRARGGARLPGRRLPAALRDDRRDRSGHGADRRSTTCRTTGGRPTAPASRRSRPQTCTGSRGELIRPDEALVLLTGDASKLREELESAELGPLEVIPAVRARRGGAELGLHVGKAQAARFEQHERVVDQVSGLRHDLVIGPGQGSRRQLPGLFGHLLGRASRAAGEEPRRVARSGSASRRSPITRPSAARSKAGRRRSRT